MVERAGQQYQMATLKGVASSNGASFDFETFVELMYKITVKKKPTYNSQGQIDGYTFDKMEIDAKVKMKMSEAWRFRLFLLQQAQQAGDNVGVLQCQFDLAVSYGTKLASMKTDTLGLCMLNEDPREANDGQDNLVYDASFFFQPSASKWADGPPMVYENQ